VRKAAKPNQYYPTRSNPFQIVPTQPILPTHKIKKIARLYVKTNEKQRTAQGTELKHFVANNRKKTGKLKHFIAKIAPN
jgi:hypothetical protein